MACLQLSQENRWPIHHSGHGALVLAALRHVAVHLLEQVEARSKAAALNTARSKGNRLKALLRQNLKGSHKTGRLKIVKLTFSQGGNKNVH